MAKIQSLSSVGIFTRDQKKARAFYVRTLGLKVRETMPKFDYLALGATKGGEDASLDLWQPDPTWGSEIYEAGMKQIGTVSGIGFRTWDFERTMEAFKRRGVKVEMDQEGERFGRFWDLDGNVLFFGGPGKVKVHRAGLAGLDWITVVARDDKQTGEFFTNALGMRGRKVPGEEGFMAYRLSSKGTAIMPFTPTREMYRDPADYDKDMAHLGEETSIGFTTRDIFAVQENLMGRGVRFSKKAEKTDWGAIRARFLDPDDNEYSMMQFG